MDASKRDCAAASCGAAKIGAAKIGAAKIGAAKSGAALSGAAKTRAPRPLMRAALGTIGLASLFTAACSSIPPPREQMAVSRSAVERASGPAGSDAAVELAAARDKMERANLAMGREDYLTARFLAEEAEADANLAEAKARSIRAAGALQEVREGIRMLREEMARRARS